MPPSRPIGSTHEAMSEATPARHAGCAGPARRRGLRTRGERERREDEFASAFQRPGRPSIGKCAQSSTPSRMPFPNRRTRAALGHVVTDPLEIVGSIRGPANEHEPHRWSIRDTTSSCSSRGPARADSRPSSTSSRNQSSWSTEPADRDLETDVPRRSPETMGGARVRRQQVAYARRRGLSSRRACALLSVSDRRSAMSLGWRRATRQLWRRCASSPAGIRGTAIGRFGSSWPGGVMVTCLVSSNQ
jgi:hypothetical protein